MLNILKTTKIEPWRFLVATLVIIAGDWGVINAQGESFLSLFNFTFLLIAGLISLTILLGWPNLKALFKKMSKGNWKWVFFAIIAEVILTYAFAFVGDILNQSLADNGAVEGLGSLGDLLLSFPFLSLSLIGEELLISTLFILTFVIINKFFTDKQSVIIATLCSLTVFGLSHYGVYDGNLYQCIVVIGLAHIPTIYAWLKTETLWVPIAIHIIYDFLLLALVSVA
ncbi:type II CAAX prenyl endopeptidase Rce1 family protein [Lactococcus taiwanensis]|uniref:CPBP family glutamic-type intramembrane protease n=1 Tax=Lactococcus taiwanensis TaxID=1151742 RepID=UPI0023EF8065|nr:CPBP family glutamic-type intramembrane protease [Lactococcus taiwanensis]